MDRTRSSLIALRAKGDPRWPFGHASRAIPFADVVKPFVPILGALLLTAASVGDLVAQVATQARPLAVPAGTYLRCRPVPIDSSSDVEKATRTFEFQTGKDDETERSLAPTFDRSGRPLLFQERTLLLRSDGLIEAHTVIAGFPDSAGMTGFHAVVRPAESGRTAAGGSALPNPSDGVRPPERTPLTDGEKSQIRALMAWLWEHRCGPKTR